MGLIYSKLAFALTSEENTYLEMQRYQRKHQRLQVLDQIIKHPEPLWIRRLCDIDKGSNFCSLHLLSAHTHQGQEKECAHLKGYVLSVYANLKLLSSVSVFLRPLAVIFFHDFALLDDTLNLLNDLFADAY
jgi:hypothetical protein